MNNKKTSFFAVVVALKKNRNDRIGGARLGTRIMTRGKVQGGGGVCCLFLTLENTDGIESTVQP